jgi:hypothetical protein
MNMDNYLESLELRLNNTEKMVQILWALLQDLQPQATQDVINNAIEKYFTANEELGADFTSPQFLT